MHATEIMESETLDRRGILHSQHSKGHEFHASVTSPASPAEWEHWEGPSERRMHTLGAAEPKNPELLSWTVNKSPLPHRRALCPLRWFAVQT